MSHCQYLDSSGTKQDNLVYLTGKSKQGNCTIYQERPSPCKEYKCAWLDGYGNEEDRPDKSLVMFDNKHGMINGYQARPLAPNHEVAEVIDRMSKSLKTPIVVMSFYERRIVRVVGDPVGDK